MSSFAAVRADAGDFDHGTFWRKTCRARGGLERFGSAAARRLAYGATAFAYQKDNEIVAPMIVHASDERVASLDTVDKTVFDEKIEGAIDRDGGGTGFLPQSAHDLVGSERPMACQQSLKDLPPHRRQPLRTGGALRFGMRNGGAGAAAVVVIRGWEYRAGHNLLWLKDLVGAPWPYDAPAH
jgi:hypothetical protein